MAARDCYRWTFFSDLILRPLCFYAPLLLENCSKVYWSHDQIFILKCNWIFLTSWYCTKAVFSFTPLVFNSFLYCLKIFSLRFFYLLNIYRASSCTFPNLRYYLINSYPGEHLTKQCTNPDVSVTIYTFQHTFSFAAPWP